MTCYHPLRAFVLTAKRTKNGKKVIVFNEEMIKGQGFEIIDLPCGQCIGCRIRQSQEWALRCVHEASMYERNCFITLTFNNEALDERMSLRSGVRCEKCTLLRSEHEIAEDDHDFVPGKNDFQLFMKRLRRRFPESRIRYFHCAEYGCVCKKCGLVEKKCKARGLHKFVKGIGRPHHHACLFNFEFEDAKYWDKRKGSLLYRSQALEECWSVPILKGESYDKSITFERQGKWYRKLGFCTIGECNFKSARYIARYVTKKITGDRAPEHYRRVDRKTGEVQNCVPEFITMSNRPGIGADWFNAFGIGDCYPKDFITQEGRKFPIPRYYDRLLEEVDDGLAERVRRKRLLTSIEKADNDVSRRRRAGEKIAMQRFKVTERRFEDGTEDV